MCKCYVVIATWGHPASWFDAKYRLNGKEYSSCCTLIPILKYLIGKDGIDSIRRTYVLGLDSVIDKGYRKDTKGGKEGRCHEAFWRCRDEKLGSSINYATYSDLIKLVGDIYRCVFEKLVNADPCLKDFCSDILGRSKFVVLPAIGRPSGNLTFESDPENYLSISLIDIGTDILRESDLSRCEKITIWFDSTHGINYMPVLTLRVSEIIAQVLRVRFRSDVEVEVYNSDPHPYGSSHEEAVLNINKTHTKRIIEVEIPRILDNKWYDIYREDVCRDDKTTKDIGMKMNDLLSSDLKSKTLDTMGSLYSPTPLALMYACHEFPCKHGGGEALINSYGDSSCTVTNSDGIKEPPMDALNRLAEIRDQWIEFTKVNNNKFIRCLTLRSNAVWAILLAYATCQSLHEELVEHVEDRGNVELFEKTVGFRYDFLKETFVEDVKSLYTRIHSTHYYVIADELSRLSNNIEKGIIDKCKENIDECIRYDELADLTSGSSSQQTVSSGKIREPNERILIAHAGLQSDLVEICCRNGVVYIKYLNNETVEKIFNSLKNIFRK